ncbi:MAG: transcription elongation factor Spt5 [Candidatus Nanoarchaeia archaeon]|jgi:transcriptional antiterminator NusG|nr:transcription elongation factor Spt5 [Candidatus Nanoarchaeia archaeon]
MAEENKTKIFTVRTTIGKEKQVIDKIALNVKKKGLGVQAIVSPSEIRGYFFMEADNTDEIRAAIYGIPNVKGLVERDIQEVEIAELDKFFSPVSDSIKVEEGDIVELSSGPFKGDKAKIKRVDKIKEEVVVELLEAAVSIPLTVKLDSIRVIQKSGEE